MMNIDQARAGSGEVLKKAPKGEGTISRDKDKKNLQDENGSPIFESEDKEVELKIPDGWKTKQ